MKQKILAILVVIFFLAIIFFSHLIKPAPKIQPFTLKNDNGRTNVLLLGTGGGQHEGPDLTDTLILVSATTSGQITMISVHRDIYMDSLDNKINSAYNTGGLPLAKSAVEQIVGMPIHYALRVDFSAFEKIIDILGGIDVNAPAVLDDYEFPVVGKENDLCNGDPELKCRLEYLHFDAGLQKMDGKTALRYVRSRHAIGDEGSDFARSGRQQLVLKALKDKVFLFSSLINPIKIKSIYDELKANIDTDFDITQPNQLINIGLNYRNSQIKNVYLDLTLLDNPPIDWRGWILLPKNGNWDEIQKYIKSQF